MKANSLSLEPKNESDISILKSNAALFRPNNIQPVPLAGKTKNCTGEFDEKEK
jgi:hypothetical protein